METGGWIAVYGAFLKDDSSFASEGDEKVSPAVARSIADADIRIV